jgi:hypothetical protein
MNDLIEVDKIAQWQKLKALVLDSVSSPITRRVQHGAGRVYCLVQAGTAARLHQGYSKRLASFNRRPAAWVRRRSSSACPRFAAISVSDPISAMVCAALAS